MDIAVETGLRISDILSLPSELSTRMEVKEQKTGKTREVTMSRELLSRATTYHNTDGRPDNGKLFDIGRWTFYKQVTKVAKGLGLEHISAHSFRKTYAYEYYLKHGLKATQEELRHDYASTTLFYVMDIPEGGEDEVSAI